ncbi:acyl-CoA desaturase [Marinicella litoralis]|uniref:Stearoyl-CoA desaturase (Delta-9 desaturase) n=1 Tax=Marinicella litoralis TaxID=644220 RepID=A0A4V3DIR9_9GAMM|nr:acyl-CoA desaturase [Marinicella litoralis]TDR23261.1 stearoyl-CoA desaturase (delta-9 desaturase) [Marinicella litoralis]
MKYENQSIQSKLNSSAFKGTVKWSPVKSIWVSFFYLTAIIGGYMTFNFAALLVFIFFTAITLCFGHSLGMHRRLIHQSYECPRLLEYLFVHLGVLVGLAGPKGMLQTHDTRDWAQRQRECHGYFGHQQSLAKDWYWQLHCDFVFDSPPTFDPPKAIAKDKVYDWMEKTWMWQQIPWAFLLFYFGGISWVIWGINVRVAVSVTGHWLIGYYAHNKGRQHWHVEGAAVQGHNIKFASLMTMGESHHNNHHAYPNSAKFSLYPGEWDPGWWVLLVLEKVGLAANFKTPENLPERKELVCVDE